jgi:DNA (cytosine-5)-methyltransferase 1
VLENVDRFFASSEFGLLKNELESGSLRRWRHVTYGVLNAADYGVPQRRRRAILIASRVGPVALPKPTHSADPTDDRLPWVTVRDALTDVPWATGPTELPDQRIDVLGVTVPGRFKMVDLHIGRRPTAESLRRYDHIRPGGNRFDLPEDLLPPCWANKPTGTTDVMGRMEWERPALTIRTEFFKPEKGRYLHPQWVARPKRDRVNRPITHLEAARLQGFPEDYEWCGTKQQIARQIGNAVPPPLARAIAGAVRPLL